MKPILAILASFIIVAFAYGDVHAEGEAAGCYDGNQPSTYQIAGGIVVCRGVDLTPAMRATGLRAFDESLALYIDCLERVDALNNIQEESKRPYSRAWWATYNGESTFCESAGLEIGQALCANWFNAPGPNRGIDPAKNQALCKLLELRAYFYPLAGTVFGVAVQCTLSNQCGMSGDTNPANLR